MHTKIGLVMLLTVSLFISCKKEKTEEVHGDKEAKILTLPLASTASNSIYGSDITFKVKFDDVGLGNYRAFARLKDGTLVYGETLYFVSI